MTGTPGTAGTDNGLKLIAEPGRQEIVITRVFDAARERLVHTFEYEGTPGHALLETVTFDEVDGKTRLTDSSVFQSVEDRDGMLKAGMEEGARELMDRFAELLARLSTR